ncbi:MAG: undecaprenyldiphospho-muramoylpentapeptide beta-N-acetylglucosaminyltransferase [Catonella sp.]
MKKIVLTGGGTAGHVTPNIALIPALKEAGFEIHYIGSYEGMERSMIEKLGINYIGISSGKLRRYKSVKNLTDPFRVLKGFGESVKILKLIKPDVVFSKGGFVTVPVVFAAKRCKIPTIIHESDMSPGLANRLCIPKADYVLANFPEALEKLPKKKGILSGTPIRQELFEGDRERGLNFCGFTGAKPVLLVVGGSLGALAVNEAVRKILPKLTEKFDVVHLCGKGKFDEDLKDVRGYKQFEYINEEMKDIFKITDIALSRAGANAICELLALRIPNVLIPLPAKASRGDQILNADSFKKQGFSEVLAEEDITAEGLLDIIYRTYDNRKEYIYNMEKSSQTDSIKIIMDLINKLTEK